MFLSLDKKTYLGTANGNEFVPWVKSSQECFLSPSSRALHQCVPVISFEEKALKQVKMIKHQLVMLISDIFIFDNMTHQSGNGAVI